MSPELVDGCAVFRDVCEVQRLIPDKNRIKIGFLRCDRPIY